MFFFLIVYYAILQRAIRNDYTEDLKWKINWLCFLFDNRKSVVGKIRSKILCYDIVNEI